MVATRRMMAAKQPKPTLPAPRTPRKRARLSGRGLKAPPATPVRRTVAQQLCGSATSGTPVTHGTVQPEKLDARVSLKKGMQQLETELYADGLNCVVGVDEAGRGPLVRGTLRSLLGWAPRVS